MRDWLGRIQRQTRPNLITWYAIGAILVVVLTWVLGPDLVLKIALIVAIVMTLWWAWNAGPGNWKMFPVVPEIILLGWLILHPGVIASWFQKTPPKIAVQTREPPPSRIVHPAKPPTPSPTPSSVPTPQPTPNPCPTPDAGGYLNAKIAERCFWTSVGNGIMFPPREE